jgi:hypothetical protein
MSIRRPAGRTRMRSLWRSIGMLGMTPETMNLDAYTGLSLVDELSLFSKHNHLSPIKAGNPRGCLRRWGSNRYVICKCRSDSLSRIANSRDPAAANPGEKATDRTDRASVLPLARCLIIRRIQIPGRHSRRLNFPNL